MPSLLRKSLRDYRRAAIGWTVGASVWVLMYLSFYSQMSAETAQASAESIPEGMRAALGWTDYPSGAGYMQAVVYGQFLPIILIFCATVFGTRAVAGPEDAGVLDLYLANPISRHRFVWERFAAMAAVVVVASVASWAVVLVMNYSLAMGVPFGNVTAASLGLLLLRLGFGSFALMLGAATGRRGLVLGVTGATAAATFMLQALANSVEAVEPLRWLSPFHYYIGADPLRSGFHVGYLLVLAGIVAMLVAAAAYLFERRDVGV